MPNSQMPDGRARTSQRREAGDAEDLRLAEERLENLRAGRSRTFSLDEVERDLGRPG